MCVLAPPIVNAGKPVGKGNTLLRCCIVIVDFFLFEIKIVHSGMDYTTHAPRKIGEHVNLSSGNNKNRLIHHLILSGLDTILSHECDMWV